MERKWTDRKCHVQDNADVAHQYVKMYCNTNKFPEISFCGTHSKPHSARGLIKYYHLRFDPKIVMGIRENFCIPCDFVIDKPWIYGIPSY